MASKPEVDIKGSLRAPLPGARDLGPADSYEQIEVSVYVRPRTAHRAMHTLDGDRPARREPMSREELVQRHGADPSDFAKIEAFAREHGLRVVEKHPGRRLIKLQGTVAAMSAAFGVDLRIYDHPNGAYRGRVGTIKVPRELAPLIVTVAGIDNRPQVEPRLKRHRRSRVAASTLRPRDVSYTVPQIAGLYDFPTAGTGSGQTVGILEFGGGYVQSDLDQFFGEVGMSTPSVTAVSVDGANNVPGDPADGEVALDIEVVGAIANSANVAVYFAPNSDQGFIDAVTAAIHDGSNNPSVISISWGGPENTWNAATVTALGTAFQDAAALGITVFAASGDNGASDGASDGLAHVDYPASDPFVTGCGGTTLSPDGSEITWSGSGGGVSDLFAVPDYQSSSGIPPSINDGHSGRGVPDIAGDADPASGYSIVLHGANQVFGGTSAVAPLWAGLTALINEQLGSRVGFLNPVLYNLNDLRDVTAGANGGYAAGPGWDACTGLGTPDGAVLLNDILHLSHVATAGREVVRQGDRNGDRYGTSVLRQPVTSAR